MAIFYKTFAQARTALSVLGLCFFLAPSVLIPGVAHANSLFTVDNVTVDATAENALKAREQAFEEAQGKAFDELAARMLSENELKMFERPPVSAISTMIKDYEVSNEKLSSTRYIGTYTFRFEDRAVRRYFSGQGAQYTDVVSRPVLILSFMDTGRGMVLWSYQNEWMKAWSAASNLAGGLVPIVVPLGDLADIDNIGDDEALTYSPRALNAMLERYDASEAVIAIAKPEGTALNIQLYRTDRERPEYVHQIFERALPGQDDPQLYARAVQSVKQILRSDWKQKTVVDTRQHGSIEVRARFRSLQEWSDLQRRLGRINGISSMNLKTLSPKEASIEILYDGTFDRFKLALEQGQLYLKMFQTPAIADVSRAGAIYELSTTPPVVAPSPMPYQSRYQAPRQPLQDQPYYQREF